MDKAQSRSANAVTASPFELFSVTLPACSHAGHCQQMCADFMLLILSRPAWCADFKFLIRRQTME